MRLYIVCVALIGMGISAGSNLSESNIKLSPDSLARLRRLEGRSRSYSSHSDGDIGSRPAVPPDVVVYHLADVRVDSSSDGIEEGSLRGVRNELSGMSTCDLLKGMCLYVLCYEHFDSQHNR